MRILIVGAGATGGAYGTLLVEAGRDVTFLVRPARAKALRSRGLHFSGPEGDRVFTPQVLVCGEASEAFDLVLVTVKATGLESAIEGFRHYTDSESRIIPILNGMAQVSLLEQEFPGQVLGGLARIVATLDGDVVRQMTSLSSLTVGALDGTPLPEEIVSFFEVPGIEFIASPTIVAELWAKWAFIAAAGVITCLFRGPIGAILDAGGLDRILEAIFESENVAAAAGYPVPQRAHEEALGLLTTPGSFFTSSLYRDLIAGHPHEGEHILGAMADQARLLGVDTPLLDLTLIQVRTGEIARSRY